MNSLESPRQDAAWSLRTPREPKAARTEVGRQGRDAVPLEALDLPRTRVGVSRRYAAHAGAHRSPAL
jgi:hypothetical protein